MISNVPPAKPDHTGIATGPFGPLVYLIVRHDGKMVGAKDTRHAALSRSLELHQCDDYEITPVKIGQIPLLDYK